MGKNILVIDDSKTTCKIIESMVSSLGHNVAYKTSGESALEYLNSNPIDLIFLDIMMPGISGFDVLDKIREDEKLTQLPVVMLTSKGNDNDVIEGYSNGADYYIPKPAEKDQLAFAIDLFID